jgi:hypothetical protein
METLICVHSNKLYPQSYNHRSCTFQKEMIKCKEETFRQTLDTFDIKKTQKKTLRIGGNRCCLFSLPRVLPPAPLPMQISAVCHHCNDCLRQSCDRNQCAQHTQRQAKVTDKRTDGRTIHQRLRFPCHLPNLVAIHKRKEPNLNSPMPHVIMESRQIS